jgi:hypothetical protein
MMKKSTFGWAISILIAGSCWAVSAAAQTATDRLHALVRPSNSSSSMSRAAQSFLRFAG